MPAIYLYLATLLVFVLLNLIALRLVFLPLFEKHMQGEFLTSPRLLPAVAFYLIYPAGVLYFASYVAIEAGTPLVYIFLEGAFFGLLAYGTYEATNYATLKRWSARMMALDVSWGVALTGISATSGVFAIRLLNAT